VAEQGSNRERSMISNEKIHADYGYSTCSGRRLQQQQCSAAICHEWIDLPLAIFVVCGGLSNEYFVDQLLLTLQKVTPIIQQRT
jgi:hypothetical protein